MTPTEKLKELEACREAVEWAEGKTWKQIWNDCERGDWMMWLLGRLDFDRKRIVKINCRIIREQKVGKGTVWDLLTDERSRAYVELLERWAAGEEITDEQRDAAGAAARAAAWDAAWAAAGDAAWDAAWAAAGDAAWAAAWAAAGAAGAAWAAAGDAAWAAAGAAGAAWAAAGDAAHKQQCDIIRSEVKIEELGL